MADYSNQSYYSSGQFDPKDYIPDEDQQRTILGSILYYPYTYIPKIWNMLYQTLWNIFWRWLR